MKINFKNIFNSSVYITPNFSDSETIRYKVKFTKILLVIFAYSLFISILTIIFLAVTPLKNVVFHFENSELKLQAEKTIELEKKVYFLTKELESISSSNKKLEYAYLLATSDSLDSTSTPYDSLKYEPSENLPYGGNLLFIFNKIFESIFSENTELRSIFVRPSQGIIINEFDSTEGHFGIDFAVKTGSPIFASQGGLIIFSDFTLDDGNKIIIQHDNGFITIYKHCSQLVKNERDNVVQGEVIGFSGNTGKNTTGPHLHFEIWKDGKPKNPKEFLIK